MQYMNIRNVSTVMRVLRSRGIRLWSHGFVLVSILSVASCTKNSQQATQAMPEKKSLYAQSLDFGNALIEIKQHGQPPDREELIRGIRESLSARRSGISQEDIDQFIAALQKVLDKTSLAVKPARSGKFVDDYAKLNAERPGVTVTASGVQYEVLHAGTGEKVSPNDTVLVKYQGKLSNGIVFDGTSQDAQPAALKLNEVVVPGLKEALLLMREGDKWRVVIPPKMGFVNFGNNRLRRRDLIYEIELIKVEAPAN